MHQGIDDPPDYPDNTIVYKTLSPALLVTVSYH